MAFFDDTNHVSSESRRDLITTGVCFASPLFYCIDSDQIPLACAKDVSCIRLSSSPKIIAQFITNVGNTKFLSSVRRSNYKFLYRGLSSDEVEAVANNDELAAIIIKEEPFDLLDSNTYNSTESVIYFQDMEHEMTAMRMPLKPSNSHIGTTNPKDAARWGQAASIWPLGEEGVDFAWLADGGSFWPTGELHIKERNGITSSMKVPGDGKCDGLSEALLEDSLEIMFRADNGFVAVPDELDKELRKHLSEMRF
ncbi:hypothetical protein ACHAXA_009669 [Cyclostephanos tholiformis]|uniref:Uncharacterized protein n=1 Tax=Cyclostephanos tholiformis TaxID=382380 RepID=A0ABD3RGN4_9STRA